MGRKLSILALLMFTAGPASAAQVMPRYGAFIYSNLCWSEQSGDAYGYRVTLILQGDDDRLELEWSEGPLYAALGYRVKVDPKMQQLTFSVNLNTGGGPEENQDYTADLSDNELVLHSSRGVEPGAPEHIFHLPRVRDLSRKTQFCQRQ